MPHWQRITPDEVLPLDRVFFAAGIGEEYIGAPVLTTLSGLVYITHRLIPSHLSLLRPFRAVAVPSPPLPVPAAAAVLPASA